MILAIGEILFDVFPGYRRLGGAPFNFAYHLKKFCRSVRFVSRVGQDEPGREILETIERHGFDLNDIQRDPVHATGKVRVRPDRDGVPEFDILPDAAYDYIELDTAATGSAPALIYFGTLVQRTDNGFNTVQRLLAQRDKGSRTFCDINLRPDCCSEKIIDASLKRTDILKLNHTELAFLGRMLEVKEVKSDDRLIIDRLFETYAIESVVVTYGENGSAWHTRKMQKAGAAFGIRKVLDTVGAGDAYAAVAALGYLENWPIGRILDRAGRFAAYVCSIPGALPEDEKIYESILRKGGRDGGT